MAYFKFGNFPSYEKFFESRKRGLTHYNLYLRVLELGLETIKDLEAIEIMKNYFRSEKSMNELKQSLSEDNFRKIKNIALKEYEEESNKEEIH